MTASPMSATASLALRAGLRPRVPFVVAAVVLVLAAASVALAPLTHQVSMTVGGCVPLTVGFALIGAVVARHQPRNPIGWVMLASAGAIIRHSIRITPNGDLSTIHHPAGGWAWWSLLTPVFVVLLGVVALAWVGSRVPALRHATGQRCQPLKCLLFGVAAAVLALPLSIGVDPTGGPGQGVAGVIGDVGALCIPISIGVGVLRYRLYEIDRLISRTLSYALLTGLLVGVFAGLVLLTTRVLPFSSPVGVAASTLVAAGLFSPLRSRLQRLVDHRFNRARYDAEATVAAFSHRLRDTVDVDTVLDELTAATTHSLEPAHVTVWVTGS